MSCKTLFCLCAALLTICSCDSGSEKEPIPTKLPGVEFIQSEEVSDSPLTLAFSWMPVDYADNYKYSLYEFVEDYSSQTGTDGSEKLVTEGITEICGKMFTASDNLQLYSGTKYILKVVAMSATGGPEASDPSEANVVTGSGPFTMTISNLTYRSAEFKVVPSDNSMLYQCATIDLAKYDSYSSDREFIETYDFGYYKHIVDVWSIPMPWYEYMKSQSEKKTKTYSSRSLSPNSEYIFYAYRTDYTGDDKDPISVSGFTKKIFTTPDWAPVSSCTFNVGIKSQTLVEGGSEVNVTVNVKPSDQNERYSVFFIPAGSFDASRPFNTVSNLIRNYELLGGITSWDTSGYSWKGEKDLGSASLAMSDQAHVAQGAEYYVAVFGISDSGCITTEISATRFTANAK